jgi:hypothetical protein
MIEKSTNDDASEVQTTTNASSAAGNNPGAPK